MRRTFRPLRTQASLGWDAEGTTPVEEVAGPCYLRYEGTLTDSSGEAISGEYTMKFQIYDSPSGIEPRWEEDHRVVVNEGEFRVILGKRSELSLPEGEPGYIAIVIKGEELRPRQPIGMDPNDDMATTSRTQPLARLSPGVVGLPVAIPISGDRGGWTDDGLVVRLDTSTDLVGIGTLNPSGKLEVAEGNGTSVLGRVDGTSSSPTLAVQGSAVNTSSGEAYGGYFEADSAGTAIHYGIYAESKGAPSAITYGTYSRAGNPGSGDVIGGLVTTTSSGAGSHYGLKAFSYTDADQSSYGVYARGDNNGMGDVYGGYFTTSGSGLGTHYGVYGEGRNDNGGYVYGGYFTTTTALNPGIHSGVSGNAYSASTASAYGVQGYAKNSASGPAHGGYFIGDANGIQATRYGGGGIVRNGRGSDLLGR